MKIFHLDQNVLSMQAASGTSTTFDSIESSLVEHMDANSADEANVAGE